jgi:hypothetical protein
MKKTLVAIFVFSLFIRLYSVSNTPPLLWDEAALGYNAYSILQTGKDEFGQFLPLIFKSFGDFKPGLYTYLTVPFVYLFGLNEISVRLPSIIFGSLTPVLLYLLITKFNSKSRALAFYSSIILAISPFSIHFSRNAWETNILTFELILASYFFLSKKFFFSALVFGLTLFTYQSAKMISLFLILSLIITNRSQIQVNLKAFLLKFILTLFIFSLPVAYGLFFGQDANRLKVVSLLSYPRSQVETEMIISESNNLDYQTFYSQPFFFTRNFLSRYFNHFSPRYLFFEGDWQNPRHSAPYVGMLLYPSLVLLPLGFFFYLSSSKKDRLSNLMLLWLIFAPIPAALTRDSVQSTRAMSLSVPLIYFSALGIYYLYRLIHKSYFVNLISIFLVIGYLISFLYYSDLYLNHMVKKNPNDFLYGHRQAIEYVLKNGDDKQVFFTNFYGQPHIFYLFYSQYSPVKYQQTNHYLSNGLDTGTVEQIDHIKFTSPQFNDLKNKKNVLVIFSWDETLRQGIDLKLLTPISPIGQHSTFYAFQN